MRKYLILTILLTQAMNLYSQIRFEIIELNVSQIIVNFHDSTWIEGDEEGPYVKVRCVLYNQSDKDIHLYPSKSKVKFLFNCKNTDYETNIISLGFMDDDSLLIHINEKKEFVFRTTILLGTDLLEDKKEDYRMTLLGLLPTLRVHYKDPKNNFFSSRIWKVNIL